MDKEKEIRRNLAQKLHKSEDFIFIASEKKDKQNLFYTAFRGKKTKLISAVVGAMQTYPDLQEVFSEAFLLYHKEQGNISAIKKNDEEAKVVSLQKNEE